MSGFTLREFELGQEFWEAVFLQTLDNENETPDSAAKIADESLYLWMERFGKKEEDS